jgi:hypothetical protein
MDQNPQEFRNSGPFLWIPVDSARIGGGIKSIENSSSLCSNVLFENKCHKSIHQINIKLETKLVQESRYK